MEYVLIYILWSLFRDDVLVLRLEDTLRSPF